MRQGMPGSESGFTYIAALVMVVIMGIMLGQAAGVWKTSMQREREVELLFRGSQVREAMQRWYKHKPNSGGARPGGGFQTTAKAAMPLNELKDLLQDPGSAGKARYLRPSMLIDPMTGKEWALVKDGQKIIGVASTSEAEPIKQANFPDEYADFAGKKKYSEWQFIYNRDPQPGVKAGGISIPGGTSDPASSDQ